MERQPTPEEVARMDDAIQFLQAATGIEVVDGPPPAGTRLARMVELQAQGVHPERIEAILAHEFPAIQAFIEGSL